jgi:D-amino-acid dehydrogenase
MRVAVIGAGIVGVTTAHELASDGHEVTVYERRGSVAGQASFANAGLVAPGAVAPWASPELRRQLLRSLFGQPAPLRLALPPSPPTLAWLWAWWRACGRGSSTAAHQRSMLGLARFSRERLHALTLRHQLEYERSDGVLLLQRTAEDLAQAQAGLALLAELGIPHAVLDADACRLREPALRRDTPLHAAIHLPDAEVGNCRQFALLLRNEAQALGARFRFHTEVERIVPGPRPELVVSPASGSDSDLSSAGADTARQGFAPTVPFPIEPCIESVDAVVVCAAMGSGGLLAPHGLRLPLAAVHGYSVTAPLRPWEGHAEPGPRSGVVDSQQQVAITRLGSRLRVTGCAEIGGRLDQQRPAALETLYRVLDDWFPGAARLSRTQRWKGAQPILPDGAPLLGASGLPGIWLNLGHGPSGWALACGSARVIADQLASRAPPVDTAGLGVGRLRR